MRRRLMPLIRAVCRVLPLAIAVILPSCIDIREEFWLNRKGGGQVEITGSLPAAVAPMYGGTQGIRSMINGFLSDTGAFTTSGCEVVTEAERLRVTINATFDSAIDLKRAAAGPSIKRLPAAAARLAGDIQLAVHGRTVEFSRIIEPGKACQGAALLPASQVGGHHLMYVMHLPTPVTDSNATRVEDGGCTLVWDIPLSQALAAPIVTRFSAQIPIPWALLTVSTLLLALLGGLLVVLWRMRRGLREPPV